MTFGGELRKGIRARNPVAVLMLGLCPAAAVSARVIDALWMSSGVIVVLLLSSLAMVLVARRGHGNAPGAPGEMTRGFGALVISSFLTAAFEAVLLAVWPDAAASLGIYAPLIAVNCLVFAGMDTASRSWGVSMSRGASVGAVMADACGKGLGFAACLVLIALLREALGAGTITLFPMGSFRGIVAIPLLSDEPARALGFAGGGLLALGYLAGLSRAAGMRRRRRAQERESRS